VLSRKRWLIVTALVLVLAMMVVGCGGQQATPPKTEAPKPAEKGGKLVFAHLQKTDSLDANVWTATAAARVMRQIYDPLVWQPEPGKFVAGLAEKWEVSKDGKVYTFNLRKDVKFHDGTKFNAAAVKFTFDRVVDPASKSLQVPRIGPYEKTEVVDEYTVKVYFKEAFPSFLSNLSEVALAPCSPAGVKNVGDKYPRFPVAAGPFKVKEWPDDNTVVLERFKDYNWAPSFMNHQGPAYLETITYKMVEETTTRYVALEKGEAQLMDGPPADEVSKLQKNPKYQVNVQADPGMPMIFQPNVTRMPTKELAVRQAMLYAVNRKQVADLLSYGVNKPGNGPLTSSIWSYDPGVEKMYPFEPEKAKKLLEDAGWKVNPKTGIREKNGQPCKIRFVASVGTNTKAGEIVQAMLKEVGIDFVVEGMAYEATVVRMAANDYECGRLGYTLLDPHDVFYLAYHSSQVEGGGQFNRSRIKDKKIDELIEAGSKEIDQAKRLATYKELQKVIMDQALILPIQESTLVHVMTTNVKGFKADSLSRPWLYNVWIEPTPTK